MNRYQILALLMISVAPGFTILAAKPPPPPAKADHYEVWEASCGTLFQGRIANLHTYARGPYVSSFKGYNNRGEFLILPAESCVFRKLRNE